MSFPRATAETTYVVGTKPWIWHRRDSQCVHSLFSHVQNRWAEPRASLGALTSATTSYGDILDVPVVNSRGTLHEIELFRYGALRNLSRRCACRECPRQCRQSTTATTRIAATSFFSPSPLPLASAITAVVSRRRRDADAGAVVRRAGYPSRGGNLRAGCGTPFRPAHLLCPFACVLLLSFFLASDRL